MPRHPGTRTPLSLKEELQCLNLAVRTRAEQVKLRRLEWDTQRLALPHITPMPGDGDLQIRKPITQKDMPAPRAPVKPPQLSPDMPHGVIQVMMDLYMSQLRDERDRNPYNKLASISAQAKAEAKQAREDTREEKRRERARARARAKAKAEIEAETRKKAAERWRG